MNVMVVLVLAERPRPPFADDNRALKRIILSAKLRDYRRGRRLGAHAQSPDDKALFFDTGSAFRPWHARARRPEGEEPRPNVQGTATLAFGKVHALLDVTGAVIVKPSIQRSRSCR